MGDGKLTRLAIGVLAVFAGVSSIAKASELTGYTFGSTHSDQHVSDYISNGGAVNGVDLSFSSSSTESLLSPHVSGVDLFSNQSVFPFRQSDYYSTPFADQLEAPGLRKMSILANPSLTLSDALSAQSLSLTVFTPRGEFSAALTDLLQPAPVSKSSSNLNATQLSMPDIAFGLDEVSDPVAVVDASGSVATSSNASPRRESARAAAASISVPSASPAIPTGPEPASIGLFGLAACGMLA